MRELRRLIGLQVISISEGRNLGTVGDVYVDLTAGELVCVTLARTPELRVVLAEDMQVIGSDALMVLDESKVKGRDEAADALERGRQVLSNPPAVITSHGTKLGQLGMVQIDEATRKVIRYEVTSGTLRDVTDGTLALPVLEGTVHGEDTVIVPHEVVAQRLDQAGGLRGKFRHLAERLRVGYDDISERSEELLRESEEKLKVKADQARKKAGELTQEARKKAEEIAEDAREAIERAKSSDEEEAPVEEAPGVEAAAIPTEDPAMAEMHLMPEAATPLPDVFPHEAEEEAEAPEASENDSSERTQ